MKTALISGSISLESYLLEEGLMNVFYDIRVPHIHLLIIGCESSIPYQLCI